MNEGHSTRSNYIDHLLAGALPNEEEFGSEPNVQALKDEVPKDEASNDEPSMDKSI